MPIRPPQKKCAIFTVWTIRNKPEIISNSATHTKKLGASMRTKTVSSMLDSEGQIMTEMQPRWKLTATSLLADLTECSFLALKTMKYFRGLHACLCSLKSED